MRIRAEWPGDGEAIRKVVAAAFRSSVQADLVDAIRASPEYIPELSLVATADDVIVGHVMISDAAIEHDGARRRIAMLSPLAVAPGAEKQGIGSALVREVIRRADERGELAVIIEGSPVFYGRLGFEPAAPLDIHIPLPGWAPREAAQVIRLTGYDRSIRGQVIYPAAFDALTDH